MGTRVFRAPARLAGIAAVMTSNAPTGDVIAGQPGVLVWALQSQLRDEVSEPELAAALQDARLTPEVLAQVELSEQQVEDVVDAARAFISLHHVAWRDAIGNYWLARDAWEDICSREGGELKSPESVFRRTVFVEAVTRKRIMVDRLVDASVAVLPDEQEELLVDVLWQTTEGGTGQERPEQDQRPAVLLDRSSPEKTVEDLNKDQVELRRRIDSAREVWERAVRGASRPEQSEPKVRATTSDSVENTGIDMRSTSAQCE